MSDGDTDERGTGAKLLLTAIIIVLMIPGLIVEPGPLSEIAGLAALGAVWGFDIGGGGDA